MPACPYGCGVNHRVAPSETNCAKFPRNKPSELGFSQPSLRAKTPEKNAISQLSKRNTDKLDRMDVAAVELSDIERRSLTVHILRWNDDVEAEDLEELSDNELLREGVYCHEVDSQYVSVNGEAARYIQTENEQVSDIVQLHVGQRLADNMFRKNPGMFRDEKQARSFVLREMANWSDSETFVSVRDEGLPRSMLAYDCDSDTFNYESGEVEADSYDEWKRERSEALVRAQYAATQRQLKHLGIEEVAVYRGLGWRNDVKLWNYSVPSDVKDRFASLEGSEYSDSDFSATDDTAQINLFSRHRVASFTTSEDMATQFALTQGEYAGSLSDSALVARTTVRAKDILALPSTGCAVYSEDELIVSAGRNSAPQYCEVSLFKRGV